jgi:antibiotic biosynthesis monooxygenase (ABM) superfamily enzyme
MGLLYFVISVIVGALLLIVLPLFIAVLGMALAVGIVIALPLILAVLILIGFIAMAPALGWGLPLAAILIALWSSDRKRRQPR